MKEGRILKLGPPVPQSARLRQIDGIKEDDESRSHLAEASDDEPGILQDNEALPPDDQPKGRGRVKRIPVWAVRSRDPP